MFRKSLYTLLACGLAWGAESFENLPAGGITSGALEYGSLSAEPGAAEIYKRARTGSQSLRIAGGAGKQVGIKLASPVEKDTRCTFWLERWTKKDPFSVKLVAVTGSGSDVLFFPLFCIFIVLC